MKLVFSIRIYCLCKFQYFLLLISEWSLNMADSSFCFTSMAHRAILIKIKEEESNSWTLLAVNNPTWSVLFTSSNEKQAQN